MALSWHSARERARACQNRNDYYGSRWVKRLANQWVTTYMSGVQDSGSCHSCASARSVKSDVPYGRGKWFGLVLHEIVKFTYCHGSSRLIEGFIHSRNFEVVVDLRISHAFRRLVLG